MQQQKVLFPLNNVWALTYDHNQWMLARYRESSGDYLSKSFIGSNKDVLYQCIEQHNIRVDGAGQAKLDKLPFKFLDWKKGMGHEVSN